MGNWEKILNLAKNGGRGDKIVLVSETLEPFVILPLEQYEALAAHQNGKSEKLSEQELLEKINHDIAMLNEMQRHEEEQSAKNSQTDDEGEMEMPETQPEKEMRYQDFENQQSQQPQWTASREKSEKMEELTAEEDFYSEPV